MDSKHIFGGVVAAFLFGFVVLYSSRRREKIKASEKTPTKKNLKSSGNGVCRSNFAGNTDVVIVGAGVAGSALAYALAKDGWRLHVIERDLTEPDRIVGEFLHAGGCIKLAELGLEGEELLAVEILLNTLSVELINNYSYLCPTFRVVTDCLDGSDSQTVFSFAAVHKDGKRSAISYPSNASGRGFHHGRFVQKLREKAASLPNVNLEQGTVTSLVEENGSIKGVLYKTKAGQELAASASLTIVCDGCFSNLRSNLCSPKIEVPSYSVGLVLEDYDLPYANRAYFILKDTIAIVYPISSNEIRCLVDVPGPKPPSISTGEMASYLKTVVAPQMPPELYNAFICAIDKGNIRTMPNKIMPASSYPTPGAFLIGDSLNMRHSVTGGGMTVGLSDPSAFAINTLASTLHTVFSSSDQDPARKQMKEAFFNYLSLGGVFSDGLMALLSGLNTNPLSLFFHCFAMLAYAVGSLLLPFPTPKRMCIAARLVLVGSGIIFPILKAEGIRATFFPATMPAYYRTPPLQSTGGMTVGLSDVVLLRDLLRPLNDLSNAASICNYLESFCVLRKPSAFAINTLASTLHTVFSSSDQDPARKEMKEAFFNYLSLGGIKASEKTRTKKKLKSSGNGVCRSNFAGNTDVIIVGAGVAGSALAYALAKDGWRVHVIERDLTEPDRIVGEFLHAGGCIKLAELGLEDCLDGSDSQTVFSFAAVHKDGKRSAISYPSNASGRGFHHGRSSGNGVCRPNYAGNTDKKNGLQATFLFGFVVLYSSRRQKTRTKKNLKSSGNGVCRSNLGGNTDVIIVGAGVAGSALAYALAKDGWRVHVIERDLTEPDRIVGEFLQAGGCMKLAELGLEDCLDGSDSQTVFSFAAVHKDGKRSAISYPSSASGRGFHHGRFVQKLREKAASLPNVKLEQGTVTSLVEENGSIKGVLYKTKAGQELAASASLTIVCDGCFSNLRSNLCSPKIEVPSYSVGLVLEDYNLPYANRAYFILKDTISIAYPISSNEIRCLVDVPGPQPPSISTGEMASYLKTVVAPQMPAELYNAFICAIDKGNIRTMPNRIMPASSYPTPGAFRIGDSLNMRHSVTGGGMTVGLSDVVLLRDLLKPLNDLSNAASICKYLESFCVLPNGIRNKYIGKHPTHSILFIGSGPSEEGNERSILQLFEPWRRVLRWTDGSSASSSLY
uniref:squalene monooxygenase n=1 Tax=Salix viminalis TaxID=40686 RepID=A0A6N2KS98_SALVM